MYKEIQQALAESERVTRQLAASRRLMDSYRPNPRRQRSLDELNRLTRDRETLSRQLLRATTTLDGSAPSAYVTPSDVAVLRRKIAALDVRIGRLASDPRLLAPSPHRGALEELGADLRVELSVAGHQLLLILGIAVANIIFFGLLIFSLPYLLEWLFSFP